VHDNDDGTVLIAAASASQSSSPPPILVWKWKPNHSAASSSTKAQESWTVKHALSVVFKLIVVLAALAYFKGVVENQVRNSSTFIVMTDVRRQGWEVV